MILVLEGENKCGKTTLAKYILDHYDFDYVKCSQPKGDPYIEYMSILKKIEKSGRNTVIDRFAYGEFVYGPIYRGKSAMTKEQLRNLELKALSLNAFLIYCYDSPENIAKRFISEGEEFADVKKIGRTVKLFGEVVRDAILPMIAHQMMTERDLTNLIVEFSGLDVTTSVVIDAKLKLKDKKNSHSIDSIINSLGRLDTMLNLRLKTAVGALSPRFVLVGEKRNEKLNKYSKLAQPFDFGMSSRYLFDEIKRAGIYLKDVLLINSDSKELKKVGVHEFSGSVVVALGRVADERLTKLKINHVTLNHPSYERRFHWPKHRIAKWLKEIEYNHCECD